MWKTGRGPRNGGCYGYSGRCWYKFDCCPSSGCSVDVVDIINLLGVNGMQEWWSFGVHLKQHMWLQGNTLNLFFVLRHVTQYLLTYQTQEMLWYLQRNGHLYIVIIWVFYYEEFCNPKHSINITNAGFWFNGKILDYMSLDFRESKIWST